MAAWELVCFLWYRRSKVNVEVPFSLTIHSHPYGEPVVGDFYVFFLEINQLAFLPYMEL